MRKLNQNGSVFVFTTLTLALLLFFVGLATDGGRAYLLKAELVRSIDSAAIAAATKINIGLPAATSAACDAFKMNGTTSCANIVVTQVTVNDAAGNPKPGIKVVGTVSTPTIFIRAGKLLGCGAKCDNINVSASAVASSGSTLDLILDLDNTGSMAGDKITNAKTGSNALVTALMPNGTSSSAMVGLVPFQGCYQNTKTNGCVDSDEYPGSGGMIVSLTNDAQKLHNGINALNAPGGSGTNVCNGLKGSRIKLFQSGVARPDSLRYLIILTDAENNFETGLPSGSVDSACIPNPNSATNAANVNLGVKTNTIASEIKEPTFAADGQSVGQTVKIFVIMYGPNATGSVPANCDTNALSSGTATSQIYTKNLARCIASEAGDVYLAPNATDITTAFQQIISRLPLVLLN